VKFQVEVLWIVTPEDGGSMVLRNDGILPQHYTASQPRRPRLESKSVVDLTLHVTLLSEIIFP